MVVFQFLNRALRRWQSRNAFVFYRLDASFDSADYGREQMKMLGANVHRQPRPEKIERFVNQFDLTGIERGEKLIEKRVQFRVVVNEQVVHL